MPASAARPPVVGIAGELWEITTALGRTTFHGAREAYVDAVTRAGGVAVVLPVVDAALAGAVCRSVDAIVLTGGGDVDPHRYGADPVPEVEDVSERRDAFELALVAEALGAGLPILAICRGMQVLNVALGGSLVQHLADPSHNDVPGQCGDAHLVTVATGSALHGIVGEARIAVNSLHHQAVDRLGDGARACAWSDDGTVEALELDGAKVVGVQWHPELRAHTSDHRALFGWLVEAAVRA